MTPDDAQAFLNENFAPWVLALEPRIEAISSEAAQVSIPVSKAIARVGGIVSGQALSALADTAMVIATAGYFDRFRPVATTNLEMQFLRPGAGQRINCRAEVVRAGKAMIFTRATLVSWPSDKAVAAATATFFIP